MKSIASYNANNQNAPTASANLARTTGSLALPSKKPPNQKEGFARCSRHGCRKVYSLGEGRSDAECRYHPGQPVFGGNYKYWTCCPEERYWEFDRFQKIIPCAVGRHWSM